MFLYSAKTNKVGAKVGSNPELLIQCNSNSNSIQINWGEGFLEPLI